MPKEHACLQVCVHRIEQLYGQATVWEEEVTASTAKKDYTKRRYCCRSMYIVALVLLGTCLVPVVNCARLSPQIGERITSEALATERLIRRLSPSKPLIYSNSDDFFVDLRLSLSIRCVFPGKEFALFWMIWQYEQSWLQAVSTPM